MCMYSLHTGFLGHLHDTLPCALIDFTKLYSVSFIVLHNYWKSLDCCLECVKTAILKLQRWRSTVNLDHLMFRVLFQPWRYSLMVHTRDKTAHKNDNYQWSNLHSYKVYGIFQFSVNETTLIIFLFGGCLLKDDQVKEPQSWTFSQTTLSMADTCKYQLENYSEVIIKA